MGSPSPFSLFGGTKLNSWTGLGLDSTSHCSPLAASVRLGRSRVSKFRSISPSLFPGTEGQWEVRWTPQGAGLCQEGQGQHPHIQDWAPRGLGTEHRSESRQAALPKGQWWQLGLGKSEPCLSCQDSSSIGCWELHCRSSQWDPWAHHVCELRGPGAQAGAGRCRQGSRGLAGTGLAWLHSEARLEPRVPLMGKLAPVWGQDPALGSAGQETPPPAGPCSSPT